MKHSDARRDRWVIDFGPAATEAQAQAYAAPYAHLERIVTRPAARKTGKGCPAQRWWIHQRAGGALRKRLPDVRAISGQPSRSPSIDSLVGGTDRRAAASAGLVFARSDDFFMGVLGIPVTSFGPAKPTIPRKRPRSGSGTDFESFSFSRWSARPHASLMKGWPIPRNGYRRKGAGLYAAREPALTSGAQNLDMTAAIYLRDRAVRQWLDVAHGDSILP